MEGSILLILLTWNVSFIRFLFPRCPHGHPPATPGMTVRCESPRVPEPRSLGAAARAARPARLETRPAVSRQQTSGGGRRRRCAGGCEGSGLWQWCGQRAVRCTVFGYGAARCTVRQGTVWCGGRTVGALRREDPVVPEGTAGPYTGESRRSQASAMLSNDS